MDNRNVINIHKAIAFVSRKKWNKFSGKFVEQGNIIFWV